MSAVCFLLLPSRTLTGGTLACLYAHLVVSPLNFSRECGMASVCSLGLRFLDGNNACFLVFIGHVYNLHLRRVCSSILPIFLIGLLVFLLTICRSSLCILHTVWALRFHVLHGLSLNEQNLLLLMKSSLSNFMFGALRVLSKKSSDNFRL